MELQSQEINNKKCIQLTSTYQIDKFISYLKFNDNQSSDSDIKNFNIHIKSDKTNYVTPSVGRFSWNFKGTSLIIEIIEEGSPFNSNGMPVYFQRIRIYHDCLDVLKEFVSTALEYEEEKEESKVTIYTSTSKGYWSCNNTIYCQDLEHIFIPKEDKDNIISNIDNFINLKDKYIHYGRKYMLTFLLTGVMGSGKTSLIKAIAKKYKKSIYFLNFTKQMTDENLFELIGLIKDNSIILIEDIDSFFEERETKENTNISFSGLINIMDGVLSSGNGIITFLTVNYTNKLDKALIRPGRVDIIIKFDYPKRREIEELFNTLIPNSQDKFKDFYDKVKSKKITMSAYVDYLFKHSDNYIENIDILLEQTDIINEITNDKTDKLYL